LKASIAGEKVKETGSSMNDVLRLLFFSFFFFFFFFFLFYFHCPMWLRFRGEF